MPGKDSAYAYGFIYIDAEAGLTLNYEGDFKILSTGEFIPKKHDSTNIKIRLTPNNVLVAFIPADKYQELKITANPEWLRYYKTDTNSIERLYRWGYLYNGWDECARALAYLERAEKINPKFKGLAVELSFSYNCLQQYDKAEAILDEEIKINPEDAYVNKEYIYTLTKNNKIARAISQFERSIKSLKDNQYNAENCYNILQYYYYQKDKENFNKWYTILQKHPNENKMLTQYADNMKNNINK
jgi:tetratricopeptide (TPR) repeat protein